MKVLLLMISMSILLDTSGQDMTPDLQQIADNLPGLQDEETDGEDRYENLMQLLSTPHDLNKITREELRLLDLLTDAQIENFLLYRNEQRNFLDIYELQIIPEFDAATIEKLLPFVTVADPARAFNTSLLQRIFSPGHSYFVSRYERTLEKKKGFLYAQSDPSHFKGSPDKLYYRLRSYQPGDYSIGLTGEKDAGEEMELKPGKNQWGFDFTSWHIQFRHKGKLRNIIVGDFQTQFAQGLLLGGAFGPGKGGESVSGTRKSNLGFLPYTSVNEGAYQRGVAFTLQPFRSVNVSAFISHAARDASHGNSEDSLAATSFLTTGLHRSEAEIRQRRKVNEKNYGIVLQMEKQKLDAGIIINAIRFSTPVKRTPTLYNQFTFEGAGNLNAGIFLNYRFQNLSLFSEMGHTLGAGSGGVFGFMVSATRNLDIAIVYRNYSRSFHTFYSNAFSENTQAQNERGAYWGWKYKMNRHYTFSGYVDMFTFPWLGYRRYAPSKGYEWILRTQYQPSKKASVSLLVREESKFRNLAEMQTLYRLGEGRRRNVTVHCDYGIGERIRFKSRVQYSNYTIKENTTEGWALVQDFSFAAGQLQFTCRHALFDTDHYDNRQYVYEHDAWLAYSLPAYHGVGVRNYALIEFKVHKQLTIWFRYARTRLLNAEEIGSGPDRIEGNTRNDVKFQARFKF